MPPPRSPRIASCPASSSSVLLLVLWILALTLTLTWAGSDPGLETETETKTEAPVPLLKKVKFRTQVPPKPRWGANMQMLRRHNSPAFDFWTEDSDSNIWEHCGLFEGDIMLHRELLRNGLLNERLSWPDATVPFYIDPQDFDANQTMVILKGFKEYHDRTCIRFRPYEKGDKHWLMIKGNYSGCWSSVGRRQGGQVLNLNTPKCVTHGVVVHELLHALGFYHQQSATERDEYVKINWENILDGHAHNFNKYARTHITNFGVEYDYQSVMHYSSRAFSKNGKATIEPLDPYASLGQRRGLSDKDVSKLNEMYEQDCNSEGLLLNFDRFGSYLDDLLDYFQGNIQDLFG
ncbi:zinc metalloproteinase nas-7 [Drosophila ananassae]|uniref:zinc metalloproteinase nas-7 n=1 Tax=Drosophila ananassae TaxID=7217 RepID=UPI0013A5CDD3|nr:zinc metalloproteinase nas-7 [Drosophila ananassae]